MPTKKSNCHTEHPDHSKELGRLNRIAGQVEGIKKMITENRYCPDILLQISAVRAALKSLETNILKPHIHCCVKEAMHADSDLEQSKVIDELLDIFKRHS
jgi:DNA-binding FrmR family transcriptional regulator